MKKLLTYCAVALFNAGLLSATAQTTTTGQTNNNGIAVSIVYDGSGSMADSVPGEKNKPTPKYIIANKAILSIIRQMQAFSEEKHVTVEAGLVYFQDSKIHQGISLGNLTPESGAAFTNWASKFTHPGGGTPLGVAIQEAQKQLKSSQSGHKHILVITDGASNAGIAPEQALHEMRAGANPIPVYFVAFDVSAGLFKPLKAEGATVVSASDEAELNAEINHILGKKILLEAE